VAEKACEGGRVFECGDYAECAECGKRIRWDLRDHQFWGFANCQHRHERVERSGQIHTCAICGPECYGTSVGKNMQGSFVKVTDVEALLSAEPPRPPMTEERSEREMKMRAAFDRTVEYIRTAMRPISVKEACGEWIWDRAHRSGLQHGLNAIYAEFNKAGIQYPAAPSPEPPRPQEKLSSKGGTDLRWLDEIETQIDSTVPYYVPRLIQEIRHLERVIARFRNGGQK
jgi:hypothetical protein